MFTSLSRLAFTLLLATSVHAQVGSRLTGPIDPAVRRTAPNSVPPQILKAQDAGRVAPSLPMNDMLLRLTPSTAQVSALDSYLKALQNPASASYQQWLSPAEFGSRFGVSDADVQKITQWLESNGFRVNEVAAGKRYIRFSGSAGQVEQLFGTEIHRFNTSSAGVRFANSQPLSIPAALSSVTAGLVSLNSFEKAPQHTPVGTVTRSADGKLLRTAQSTAGSSSPDSSLGVRPGFTSPGTPEETFLAPGDFARIYNTLPLVKAGTDGTGMSIAIVGRSDISLSDIEAFRTVFGLPFNDPKITYVNGDPGVIPGDDEEAVLDTEWSGAVAPKATIHYVIGSTTYDTDGVDLAASYIVDHVTAPIMSVSFGECEQALSQTENDFFHDLWQQASAEGITVLVSAGDSGSSSCDIPSQTYATPYPLGVNGLASTPYNVAVGGTEFLDKNLNTFWNISSAVDQSSAKGYIPEAVWNESCNLNLPVSLHNCYFSQSYESTYAGGGGKSSCSTHPLDSKAGIITGLYTCLSGYPEPEWQVGPGVPQDGVRHLPDVSLAAAGGHDGYLICYNGSCQFTRNSEGGFTLQQASVIGGTSASSPSMAGIFSLLEQRVGKYQGQINYKLYPLAAQEKAGACNSSSETDPSSPGACAFHDVTANTNTLSCVIGSLNPDCTVPVPGNSTFGLLSGYKAMAGYDQATGLGSVDAVNLLSAWSSLNTNHATTTMLALTRTSFTHGNTVGVTVQVAPVSGSGTPTGDIALRVVSGTAPSGPVLAASLSAAQFTQSVSSLPGGTYLLVADYGGDEEFRASTSAALSLTVAPEPSSLAVQTFVQSPFYVLGRHPIHPGNEANLNESFYVQVAVSSASGAGVSTGTVTLLEGAKNLGSYPLDKTGSIYVPCGPGTQCDLTRGHHTLTANYSGSSSLSSSSTHFLFTLDRGSVDLYGFVSSSTPPPNTIVIGTVYLNYDPAVAPTGRVTLTRDDTGATLGTGTVKADGTATIPFRAPAGTYNVLPSYGGDANYKQGIVREYSQITTEGTGKVATTTALTISSPTASLGGKTQVNVIVAPVTKGKALPTGTVTLHTSDGGQTQPYNLVNGHLSTSLEWNSAGPTTFYATYNGDSTFAGSSSPLVTIAVLKATPTVALQAPRTALAGKQTSISALLTTPLSATQVYYPTGVVQFYDSVNGGPPRALAPPQALNTGNRGTLLATIAPVLGVGKHTISAYYRGDGNWNAAEARPIVIEVELPVP